MSSDTLLYETEADIAAPGFTETELRAMVEAASTLQERLGPRFEPVAGSTPDEQRLVRWCQVVAKGDWALFRKRLHWDGLDLEQARDAVRPARLRSSSALRAWTSTLNVCLAAIESPDEQAVVIVITYLKQYRLFIGATGAEMMQRFIWICLFLFALAQGSIAETAALGFIAFQGLFAYFMAGLSKLRASTWRDGTAVGQVVATEAYGTSFTMTLPYGWVSPFLTYSTLVFEIAGPFLILLGAEATLVFFAMALLFHVSTAVVSGLTAFVFAFPATYPAIYWIVVQAPSWV